MFLCASPPWLGRGDPVGDGRLGSVRALADQGECARGTGVLSNWDGRYCGGWFVGLGCGGNAGDFSFGIGQGGD